MKVTLSFLISALGMPFCFSQNVQFNPDPIPQSMSNCIELDASNIDDFIPFISSPSCITINSANISDVEIESAPPTIFVAEAGKSISLKPNVHLKSEAHLKIDYNPIFDMVWYVPNTVGTVEHHGKMEIGLNLSDNLNDEIANFFDNDNSNGSGLNPYNRHDIDIQMTFFRNGVPLDRSDAFYYLPQKIENNDFAPDTTSFNFRIRHSPRFIGEYLGVLDIFINGILLDQSMITFNVIPSNNPGYLEQGKYNKHLRYAKTKQSFFGVGQVIPWAVYPNWYNWNEASTYQQMTNEITIPFEKLNQAGGNFSRIVAATWCMEFEAEVLGNYSPKQNHAWYLDRLADFCSDEEIYFLFCMRLHASFETHYNAQGQLTNSNQSGWGYNPYNADRLNSYPIASEPPIGITEVSQFYSDPTAKDHYKNYIRYVVSRWGYAPSIAGWQIMSEIDNTADYRSNTTTQNHVFYWVDEMLRFIATDQYDRHLRSVSAMGSPDANYSDLDDVKLYGTPYCNFSGIHQYIIQDLITEPIHGYGNFRNRNVIYTYEAARNVSTSSNGNIGFFSYNVSDNLMFFDEHGIGANRYDNTVGADNSNVGDATTGLNRCQQNSFHNDLWATICSGAAVAGLEWKLPEDPIRQAQWFNEFPHLQTFFSTIDFESKNYSSTKETNSGLKYIASRWPWLTGDIEGTNVGTELFPIINPESYSEDNKLEAIAMVSDDKTQGFGWCKNRSYYWWNMQNEPNQCINAMVNPSVDLNDEWQSQHLFPPKDDDLVTVPINIGEGDAFFEVRDLAGGAEYEIRFFDTRTGTWIHSQDKFAAAGGDLKIVSPDMTDYPDLAFTIRRKGYEWKNLSPDSIAMHEPKKDELLINEGLKGDYSITLVGHTSSDGAFVINSVDENIQSVEIFSTRGDRVDEIVNIDSLFFKYESRLPLNTYFVTVRTANTEKTFKIIVAK